MHDKNSSEPRSSDWHADRHATVPPRSLFIKGEGDLYILNLEFRKSRDGAYLPDDGPTASGVRDTAGRHAIEKSSC